MARKLTLEESLQNSIAKRLSGILYEKRITQKEFADKVGVSAPTVSAWCNGTKTPRMDKVDTICEVLGITREDLLGEYKYLPGKRNPVNVVAEEPTKYEANTPITMEDIALAAQIAKADPQTKRLIKYLLAFNEAEEKEKDR